MMKKILIFVTVLIMIIPNLVGCKTRVKSYTLQDAYEKGLITKEELVSIAYYWNNDINYNKDIMGDNYTPIPKKPEELSDKTIDIIKSYIAEEITKITAESINTHNSLILDDKIEPYSKEHVQIMDYFGTYNNLICIRCTDAFSFDFHMEVEIPAPCSITIDGVKFRTWLGNYFITCYEIK